MRAAIDGSDHVSLVTAVCVETDGALKVVQARGTGRWATICAYLGSFAYMTTGNLYPVSFSTMERRLLLAIPSQPAEANVATDWYWALWLTAAGDLAFVTRPMGFYRIHASNAGHNNSERAAELPPTFRFLIPHFPANEGRIQPQRLQDFVEPDLPRQSHELILDIAKSAIKIMQASRYSNLSTRLNRPPFRNRVRWMTKSVGSGLLQSLNRFLRVGTIRNAVHFR